MTLEDLIRRFRVLSMDNVTPPFWAAEDVTDWLNDAQNEACIRARLIREDELEAVCRIALTPGTHTYALNPLVYEIISLWIKPATGRRRTVTLRFPWWHLDLDGHGDTGFGLLIHFDGNEEAMAEAKTLRPGDFVSVTGEIVPSGRQYFYIGNVTELRRVSEKEEFPPREQ